jgi:hypothetical protein
MKPVVRLILAPLVVAAAAWGGSRLFIGHEEQSAARAVVNELPQSKESILALRIAAVDAAKKAYQVSLEEERMTFEREKKEADFPELVEMSHTVRTLRIDLEYQTALAAIDKKYPPPNPLPSESPDQPNSPAP